MSKLKLKIPPVAQGLIALTLLWLLHRYIPILTIRFSHQSIMGWAVIGMGFLVGLAGVIAFIKMRTTVDPRHAHKASKLVVIGIYKYSRNPMYLGILLGLSGAALYSGALSTTVVLILFVLFINRYQIIPEEVALKVKFGESYARYLNDVRRWI